MPGRPYRALRRGALVAGFSAVLWLPGYPAEQPEAQVAASDSPPVHSRPSAHPGYNEQLTAFARLSLDMTPDQVQALLGPPNRVQPPDPGEDWYEVRWIYDFRQLRDYPRDRPRQAPWFGEVLFDQQRVVHLRRVGWLE